MDIEELIAKLKESNERHARDEEAAHWHADQLLLEYVNDTRVRELFNAIEKWYA